jgi:hypothetical protein
VFVFVFVFVRVHVLLCCCMVDTSTRVCEWGCGGRFGVCFCFCAFCCVRVALLAPPLLRAPELRTRRVCVRPSNPRFAPHCVPVRSWDPFAAPVQEWITVLIRCLRALIQVAAAAIHDLWRHGSRAAPGPAGSPGGAAPVAIPAPAPAPASLDDSGEAADATGLFPSTPPVTNVFVPKPPEAPDRGGAGGGSSSGGEGGHGKPTLSVLLGLFSGIKEFKEVRCGEAVVVVAAAAVVGEWYLAVESAQLPPLAKPVPALAFTPRKLRFACAVRRVSVCCRSGVYTAVMCVCLCRAPPTVLPCAQLIGTHGLPVTLLLSHFEAMVAGGGAWREDAVLWGSVIAAQAAEASMVTLRDAEVVRVRGWRCPLCPHEDVVC